MSILSLCIGTKPFIPPVGVARVICTETEAERKSRQGENNAEIRDANQAAALAVLDEGPAVASAIAAEIGVSTPTARRILTTLVDQGKAAQRMNDAGVREFRRVREGEQS